MSYRTMTFTMYLTRKRQFHDHRFLPTAGPKNLTPFKIRVGGVVPAIHNADGKFNRCHWAQLQDELTRTAEYIISNDYFSGRVVAAEV